MDPSFPQIFQTENLKYEDRFSVYWNEILQYCKPGEVRERIAKYVAQHVSPSEWNAIWRSTSSSNGTDTNCDILVEVTNVDVDTLTAEVGISTPLVCDCPQPVVEKIRSHLTSSGNLVPLMELYAVYEESGDFDETALAIEHVRFFYDHIWREWDADDDSDCFYAARNLETRLRLHYDMNDGTLPNELVNKYKNTYDTYKQKLSELNRLRQEMGANDSEQEYLEDADVLCCVQKSDECEALVHSLQIIENPQMRYLLASITPSITNEQTSQQRTAKGARTPDGLRITIIVAPQLKAFMASSLPEETVIEHYKSFEQAIENSYEGDTILVYPGSYVINTPCFVKDSVVISGIGDQIEITANCSNCDDYAIVCQAENVVFKNITFTAAREIAIFEGIVRVLQGHTTMEDCCLDGSLATLRAAWVVGGASLTMKSCRVQAAQIAGVTACHGSTLVMSKSDICKNGVATEQEAALKLSQPNVTGGGIQLQVEPSDNPLQVVLENNTIHNNYEFGVCAAVNTDGTIDVSSTEVNIALTLKDNTFINNKDGDVDSFVEAHRHVSNVI